MASNSRQCNENNNQKKERNGIKRDTLVDLCFVLKAFLGVFSLDRSLMNAKQGVNLAKICDLHNTTSSHLKFDASETLELPLPDRVDLI